MDHTVKLLEITEKKILEPKVRGENFLDITPTA